MDYSGHFPKSSAPLIQLLPKPNLESEETKSAKQRLLDQMMEENDNVRADILRKLIEDPGVVATFNEDFIVEFAPMEVRSLPPTPEDRNLNEYRLELVQRWRIRRRTEEDG